MGQKRQAAQRVELILQGRSLESGTVCLRY